ncbi:hypothetical protein EV192_101940 [Actinocrispum wychmicini]|uniref:WD40 repeat protein n=2 Tax=Actinocrispum wychmicini TaxID=1213861 RepID=A0A4R2K0K9_9PSEU|nr:hypothetical protein EV192_101940 [Actinocrispum wychmicini]
MSAHRVVVGVVAIVVLVVVGGGYVAWTAANQPAATANAAPPVVGDLMFVDLTGGQNLVTTVKLAQPGGPRTVSSQRCQRFYRAVDTSVCLRLAGLGPSYEAAIFRREELVKTIPLPGIPSRARVSVSGNIVSWTSFVTGDSYTIPGGFSTRSGVFDIRTGTVTDSIEHFTATIAGRVTTAADINYWGITVGADDKTFYATLASSGRTYLVRGDLTTQRLDEVRQTAECPSISPDGTRVAYKKRPTPTQPWSLVVYDLKTKQERQLPGTTGIDDQAAWLDDSTLAYGAAVNDQKSAVYFVPADGSAPARQVIPNAASPVPVR